LIQELSSPNVQTFIRQHESHDISELLLKHDRIHNVPMAIVAEQIVGRKKAKDKLPTYYETNSIIYPPGLNVEQCSSEQTAHFKSTIAESIVEKRETLLDLTGGFGIDSLFFSRVFRQVHYLEPNKNLFEIARHNHQLVKANEILHLNLKAEEFLRSTNLSFDLVYIDPSRRDSGNRKVFSFADCEPDVTELVPLILGKTSHLLIKASPLLDLQHGRKSLISVKSIFVIAVENECKEVLFHCEKNFAGEPVIEAIHLSRGNITQKLNFTATIEKSAIPLYSQPLLYIYEPNAAILKAGAFKTVCAEYNVLKLHPHTHLYTSDVLDINFPGRIFRIMAQVKPDSKTLESFFPQRKANIMTRNYPLSVKELRNKTGLKDGGELFLIGFSGSERKFLVVAQKVS
jgi:predicted O-methyltransferase YrrM